jgi:hypothetical protein
MDMPDVRDTITRGGADLADPSLPAMGQAVQASVALFVNAVRIAGIKGE